MRSIASTARRAWRGPVDLLALGGAAAYLALLASIIAGGPTPPGALLILPLPLLVPALVILADVRLPPLAGWAAAIAGIALAAYLGALIVPRYPLLILGLPAVIAVGMLAARRPTVVLFGCLIASGTFGSLDALASVPAAKVTDLLLLGLWGAVGWNWAFNRSERLPIVPSLVALGLFIALSAVEILAADNLQAAVQAFRGQFWYLAVVVLIALAPWTLATRQRMLRSAVVAGLVVGGYATLRWQIGPAGAEQELGATSGNNFVDGELGVIGSFATRKELAFWTAILIPFLFGLGLAWRGRWRMVALAGAAACVVAMLASDVRAGIAAAGPGVLLVVGALPARAGVPRAPRADGLFVVLGAAAIAVGAFSVTLGGKEDVQDRYGNILAPNRDASYQARIVKWRQALDDIDTAPFGHGLGSAGRAQKRYGTASTVVNVDVDNSYLTVAYQQGFVAVLILAGIFLMLLLSLVRAAVFTTDSSVAAPALAGAGTLASMLIIFYVGEYIEGLPVLAGWILVGLGMAHCHAREDTGGRDMRYVGAGLVLAMAIAGAAPATAAPLLKTKVDTSRPGPRLPKSFVGLSQEYEQIEAFSGIPPGGANASVAALVGRLGKLIDDPVVLRVGGGSTDGTWVNPGVPKPPDGIYFNVFPRTLAGLSTFAEAADVKLIMGLNLGLDDPALLLDEARAFVAGLPASRLIGLEVGNEPNGYPVRPLYEREDGKTVFTRPKGYGPRAYAKELGAFLPELDRRTGSVPLLGPSIDLDGRWVAALPRLLRGKGKRLDDVTVHSYLLSACTKQRRDPRYPSVRNLASQSAFKRQFVEMLPVRAAARRAHRTVRLSESNSVACGVATGSATPERPDSGRSISCTDPG